MFRTGRPARALRRVLPPIAMGFNAILKGDDERFRADHWPHISGSLLHLPSLYPEKNHVDRTNLRWIVSGFGRMNDNFPGWRFEA